LFGRSRRGYSSEGSSRDELRAKRVGVAAAERMERGREVEGRGYKPVEATQRGGDFYYKRQREFLKSERYSHFIKDLFQGVENTTKKISI